MSIRRVGTYLCNGNGHRKNYNCRWLSLSSCNAATTAATATKIGSTDVLVVGGGVVGSALCDLIGRHMPDLSVVLVEASKQSPPSADALKEINALPHPRSYALSPASLELLGLCSQQQQQQQQPQENEQQGKRRLGFYDRMQVWEANQPAYLSFAVTDLPDSARAAGNITCLGACVEDHVLLQELQSRFTSNITVKNETKVADFVVPANAAEGLVQVRLQSHSSSTANQKPTDCTFNTKLLIAADGANSSIRQKLGIPFVSWDYGQTALTFTVKLSHQKGMQRRAFQRFLPTGPLALLPTHLDDHAIIVWSTTPEQALFWKNQHNSTDLVSHLNALLQQGPDRLDSLFPSSSTTPSPIVNNLVYGVEKLLETLQYGPAMAAAASGTPPQPDDYGRTESPNAFVPPPIIADVVSAKFTFPLANRQVTKYTAPRIALIGDAAHSVHPMAGQGLNLGLLDVAALLEQLQKAHAAGMDLTTFLNDYDRGRHGQVSATVQGIHLLHTAFHMQQAPFKHAKSLGMNLIQNIKPLRQLLVQAACQGVAA